MPVVVEFVRQPSAQDRLDLAKIYAEAPDWLLPPYNDAQHLLDSLLDSGQLLAGRFNDRLLGAACVTPDSEGWQLSHLCVRQVTRRRGVARRLYAEACRLAAEAGQALHWQAPPGLDSALQVILQSKTQAG